MIPKRSASYRGSEVAAISIAQHMIPKWRGQVEFRFAQLKKSPTTPALRRSRTAPPGPRRMGASMFRVTHRTKSWDFRPTMFACSALWIMTALATSGLSQDGAPPDGSFGGPGCDATSLGRRGEG